MESLATKVSGLTRYYCACLIFVDVITRHHGVRINKVSLRLSYFCYFCFSSPCRFLSNGWEAAEALDMNQVYKNLPHDEVQRLVLSLFHMTKFKDSFPPDIFKVSVIFFDDEKNQRLATAFFLMTKFRG